MEVALIIYPLSLLSNNMNTLKLVKSFSLEDIDSEGTISGYASVFNNVDSYGDIIIPEAYDEILNNPNKVMPKMFFNHNSWDSIPVGIWKHLGKDSKGLRVKGSLNLELDKGRELNSAIKQGAVDGLSVAIIVSEYEYSDDDTRIIKNIIAIPEISICTYPANPEARLDIKSKLDNTKSLSDYERILRDAGFSKSEATAFISRLKKSILCERDACNKIDELYTLISSIGRKNGS